VALSSLGLLVLVSIVGGCSSHKLATADAQRLIESSSRFSAPDVLRVRSRYCSTVNAPTDSPASGLGRLKALEGTGAIRIEHRAAAPGECATAPGPMREWLVLSLTDVGDGFHPRSLPDATGWEFTLARRRFVSIGELTFNSDDEPTIAHAAYKWAWKAELVGQLLQTSEEPVNAQATFVRPDTTWELRDVGF
jgi:hypothetical protein